VPDAHGREAFQHPALSRLNNFNAKLPQDIVTREKIERLAIDVGLDKVVRWKPRLVRISLHVCRSCFNLLTISCTAREPGRLRSDDRPQRNHPRHHWRHLPPARRRGCRKDRQGEDTVATRPPISGRTPTSVSKMYNTMQIEHLTTCHDDTFSLRAVMDYASVHAGG
jgi:hypothetical protein